MCPICGELEAGLGQRLVPVALGDDCKGNVICVLDVNAEVTACLPWESIGFVVAFSRVRGLTSCCPLPAEATEHR
jgi:hypothetical protein